MPEPDSALKIDIALRSALIARAVLECINLDPHLVRLQLSEAARQIRELDERLARGLG